MPERDVSASNRRLQILVTAVSAQLMLVLSSKVVTIALPSIQADPGINDAAKGLGGRCLCTRVRRTTGAGRVGESR